MSTKNVFKINDVHDRVVAGCWITYNIGSDPGTLWAWGNNGYGAIGDNTRISRSSPVQIPGQWLSTAKSSSYQNSAAINFNRELFGWGRNTQGQIGNNSIINRCSPNQVPGTNWCMIVTDCTRSLALKTDGTLWAWGSANNGSLGDNTTIPKSSPIQIPGTSWVDVGGNSFSSHARKSDGTLWGWGCNTLGSAGIDLSITVSSPVQIPGNSWVDVSSGSAAQHSFARKSDGSLWAWGRSDAYAVLGAGGNVSRSSPIQVPGNIWSCALAGCCHSVALRSDGTLWTWGKNDVGQLGIGVVTGSSDNRTSPVQVPGTWSLISTFNCTNFAIRSNCTLWAFGEITNGNAGTNSGLGNHSSPTQIPGNWISVGSRLARKAS